MAEDATQQALVSVWRNLPRLREPARFEGWSTRLLVNACHDQVRRPPRWTSTDAKHVREPVNEFEDDWVVQHKDESGDLQMDDPRLSGTLDLVSTIHEMRGSGERVLSSTATVTNDLGSWVGTRLGYNPAPGAHEWFVELAGEDGYEGLGAMLFFQEDLEHRHASHVRGIIHVGPQPPLPEQPIDPTMVTSKTHRAAPAACGAQE